MKKSLKCTQTCEIVLVKCEVRKNTNNEMGANTTNFTYVALIRLCTHCMSGEMWQVARNFATHLRSFHMQSAFLAFFALIFMSFCCNFHARFCCNFYVCFVVFFIVSPTLKCHPTICE